jgi:hypothetical protein
MVENQYHQGFFFLPMQGEKLTRGQIFDLMPKEY